MFCLLKKHNCVETCLSTVETECSNASRNELMPMQINSSVRHGDGKGSKGNDCPLCVLNGVMESANGWTKNLLMGPNEQSWRIHSLNLTRAHRSNNFKNDPFAKHRLDVLGNDDIKRKEHAPNSTKIIEPRKTAEKRRIHEWAALMFEEDKGLAVCERDNHARMKSLAASLNNPESNAGMNDDNDALESRAESMFDDTQLTLNKTNDEGIACAIDDEAIEASDKASNRASRGKANAFSVIDIFNYGNNELLKANVNHLRWNKKKLLKQSEDFYCGVRHSMLNDDDEFDMECDDLVDSHAGTKPWFRISRNILS